MSSINSAAEMFSIPFSGPKNVGTLEMNFANVGRICVLQPESTVEKKGRETNGGNEQLKGSDDSVQMHQASQHTLGQRATLQEAREDSQSVKCS